MLFNFNYFRYLQKEYTFTIALLDNSDPLINEISKQFEKFMDLCAAHIHICAKY